MPAASLQGHDAGEREPARKADVHPTVSGAVRRTAAGRDPSAVTAAGGASTERPAADTPSSEPSHREQHGDGAAKPVIPAGEYIAALRASGDSTGIAAFPPPGTNPPKTGVIVPDAYELPEGYVRHYQTTDDGQQLAPILTLSPDYDLLDDAGEPIELPPDRILPPHLAPPDLDVEMLEVPASDARTANGP